MKYSIYLNQSKLIERDLSLSEGCVMNILTQLSTWCEAEVIDGEVYYYLSAGKLVDELPGISKSKGTFYNILKRLKKKGIVEHKNHKNKGYYRLTEKGKQWDYTSKNEGSHKIMSKVSQNNETGLTKKGDNHNTNYNNNKDNIYKDIFNHRLKKGIVNHRQLRKSMKRKIKTALKEYDKDEIKEAIDTYAKVFHSKKTYFTHKRTLKEFVQRGIDQFLSKQIKDYYKDGYKDVDKRKEKKSSAEKKKREKRVEKNDKNVINGTQMKEIVKKKSS